METYAKYEVHEESSHEGDLVKENVLSNNNSEWKSKHIGFPAWISFKILDEQKLKTMKLRTQNGCNTAPKDMVVYTSEDSKSWVELIRVSRPQHPGSDWTDIELNVSAKFVKLEVLNNQNLTDIKDWSTYTYVYEVKFLLAN